jgi:Meiotically Up-regulated Gene 113 (MUG113) protein
MAGIVYFTRQGNRGPTKIGWTLEYPVARLSGCQTGNPDQLFLCKAEFRGPRALEAQLHRHYRSRRILGEWFSGDELLALSNGRLPPC